MDRITYITEHHGSTIFLISLALPFIATLMVFVPPVGFGIIILLVALVRRGNTRRRALEAERLRNWGF